MKPFYQDDLTTLYHGDGYELAPLMRADLVFTDPDNPGVTAIPISENCETIGLVICADNRASFGYQIGDLLFRRRFVAAHPKYRYLACHVYEDSNPLVLTETHVFGDGNERLIHPGQKPLDPIRWFLEVLNPIVVLDPFCGAGTTLVAARELGIPSVGIEINERFCELAVSRL
jgi:site-specific DNA-methyltransferase (adenine-specific)